MQKRKRIKRFWKAEIVRTASPDDAVFYNSQRWRNFRKRFLKENPLCVACLEKGIIAASEVADHIIQIRRGGAKWDKSNLQALCRTCHARKSGREAHYKKWEK